MRFASTREILAGTGLSRAIRDGAAPDGGLYLPEAIPAVMADALADRRGQLLVAGLGRNQGEV